MPKYLKEQQVKPDLGFLDWSTQHQHPHAGSRSPQQVDQ